MNTNQLQLSHYNYDAATLVNRVRELFERDASLLGDVLVRSALIRPPGSAIQHVLTRIDVLPKDALVEEPQLLDYNSILFVKETITKDALLSRLELLSEKRFQVGEHSLNSTGPGFHDTYEHGRNSYSDWPCILFQVSFGSVQLSYEPLLHPTLKSFSSTYDAV